MPALFQTIMNEAVAPFLYLVFAIAIAVFIFGIIEFIAGSDSEEKRAKGKQHLIWGVVGLLIMFGVWGLIAIIQNFIDSLG